VTTGKVIRALVGLAVLVILLVVVNGWWADYKNATPKSGSAETTSTAVAPETAPPAAGPTVLVLTDGLNFREKPDATGASIRGLKKGETFVLVSQSGSWLELSDAAGQIGWVNNNPQYVRIEKKK
jgi:SH3-like domain-containing protein